MDDRELHAKLAELMSEISTLPAAERRKLEESKLADSQLADSQLAESKLAQWADQQRQRHERLRQTVCGLQESLDYLRLSIKYLVFDLEATRRENGRLKRMLESSGNAD